MPEVREAMGVFGARSVAMTGISDQVLAKMVPHMGRPNNVPVFNIQFRLWRGTSRSELW